jgi:type IV pilus assembly protein PilE
MGRGSGFTVIELVVTVAIVAILASIALPSYASYMRNAARADAQAFTADAANRRQQHLADRPAYASSRSALEMTAPATLTGKFSFSIAASDGPPPSFTITGTATGDQTHDDWRGLDRNGFRLARVIGTTVT